MADANAFENAFDDLFREGEGLANAGDWIRDNGGNLDGWIEEIQNSCKDGGECKFPGSGESAQQTSRNTYINENGELHTRLDEKHENHKRR